MKKEQYCTLYVSGMHCASCEVLIEKKLSKIKGISSAKASLSNKEVTVQYNAKKPEISKLNSQFADLGYTFSEKPVGGANITIQSIITGIGIAIVLFISFLILEDMNVFSRFSINKQSGIPAFFGLGVVASLSTCAALVGGLLLSLSKQWNELYGGKDEQKRIIPFAMFNVGRLISYAVLGALLGYVGSFFTVSLQSTALLIILVSILMIIIGLQMLGIKGAKTIKLTVPRFISKYISDEQNFKGKYMPFATGALTFFIPCGFTLMAQTVALATGNALTSMLMMFAFALGTLPVLAILSFSSLKFQKNIAFAGTFNLLVGLFIVAFGIFNINAQFNVLGWKNLNDVYAKTKSVNQNSNTGVKIIGEGKNKYQEVTMEAKGFEYYPKNITLLVNVPAKFTIKNSGVLGCAQAMYMPGLYEDVIYLSSKQSKAEFTPKKLGTYKISCTMGMVPPVTVQVIEG